MPAAGAVRWERAAAISGLLELTVAIIGMGFWYMRSVAPMIASGADAALTGKFGREVTEHQIAGAALVVFATHPLTWLFVYAFGEGALRLFAAAFAEDVVSVLPFFLAERALFVAAHPQESKTVVREMRQTLAATFALLRERLMIARLPNLPDELHYTRDSTAEILEIWASRRKEDWAAPKIVHVDEAYYRLEKDFVEMAARPFRYRLRRLEAGVPGRGVLSYKTAHPPAQS